MEGSVAEKFNFQPTTKRLADIDGPDYYPTPSWATHALIENETFEGDIWECACGDGAMADVLKHTGNKVFSSDLFDRGYGKPGIDFLDNDISASNIVTNPPFHSAEAFVHEAFQKAEKKFAFLFRLAFLESANRANSIFLRIPPTRVWVFSERITFYPSGAKRAGSGTTAYAWFVWDKNNSNPTELCWIKPGTKKKFS